MLNDSTILDSVKRVYQASDEQNEMVKLIELGKWAVSQPEESFMVISAPDSDMPSWDEHLFPPEGFDQLRQKFENGQRIAFRVPLTVELASGDVTKTHFKIFLERDRALTDGSDRYIRQGITLPEMRMIRGKQVRGLVVVEDGPLSTLLGDAENPSHTSWEERSSRVRDAYTKGASRVRFVKNSLKFIVALLSRVTKAKDENLLKDFFFINTPKAESAGGFQQLPGKPDEKESTRVKVDVPSNVRPFRVDYVTGGFRVVGSAAYGKVPPRVEIEAAYDLRRGNPFTSYETWDFELDKSPIKVETHHTTAIVKSKNKVTFSPSSPDFSLTITGFDLRRDVIVRVKEVTD